jgi:hypothetical protein
LLTSIFTFFQSRLERRISKGYVRTTVQAGTGFKRTQFIPMAGGRGGGAGMVEMPIPPDEDEQATPMP